jgi:site-specific DNA recombinase
MPTKEWGFLMPQKIRRCAIYRRISDEDQKKGYSLQEQETLTREAIAKNGGVLKEAHIFTDVYTGTYWRERPGLQAMLACARRHEFDFLYMTELDRFARDVIAQEFVREELKYYGVTTITLIKDEHADDDSVTGQMVRYFWGLMAQEERKKIISRTQRGMRRRVKNSSILAGRRPLYGYLWMDKVVIRKNEEVVVPKACYVLNPTIILVGEDGTEWTEPKVVCYVYLLADAGTPIRRIAMMLTNLGLPTPNGKEFWRPQTILNILANPFYIGEGAAYRQKFTFIPGEGIKKSNRPKDEWLTLPNGVVPAIITPEVFERVQKRLAYNKLHAPRNNKHPEDTLLRSGHIVCGYCGHNLAVHRDKGKDFISYRCYMENMGYDECRGTTTGARLADTIAWQKAIEIIVNPALLAKELERRKIDDPTKGAIAAAENLLIAVNEKIINLTGTIEQTSDPLVRKILALRLEELSHSAVRLRRGV